MKRGNCTLNILKIPTITCCMCITIIGHFMFIRSKDNSDRSYFYDVTKIGDKSPIGTC